MALRRKPYPIACRQHDVFVKPNSEEHLSIMSTTAASLSTSFSRIQAILNPFSLRRAVTSSDPGYPSGLTHADIGI